MDLFHPFCERYRSMRFARTAALSTAAAALVALGLGTTTASAGPQPVRSGSPASTVDRVADFYGAYIDAHYGTGMGSLGSDLRSHYLTKGLQKQLAVWERRNHADGVLHAQDVPNAWSVTAGDSGAGHTWTTVTFTWGGKKPTHTHVTVQSDLATGLISDIK